MEDIFEAMIGIAVIIVSLAVKLVSQSKKVKQNAPGKAAAPEWPAAPAAPSVPHPIRPTVQPTVHPTVSAPAEQDKKESFWQQMSQTIQQELGVEAEKADHGPKPPMDEGDSRECDHGSVGGSMEYGAHEGGQAVSQKKPVRAAYGWPKENAAAYRPAMNAEEMRRAVVMAEILKRPQERMAEQARRWSVR